MAPYFCFDFCVDQVWCAENGITLDVDGAHIQPDEMYYVCLSVLLMGFSWSFWIVQEMVVGLCQEAGVPLSNMLVAEWPAPSLADGVVCNPYCDNLNLIGLDPDEVNSTLRRLLVVFRKKGFDLHEIEWAREVATPLGSYFNGSKNYVGSKPAKLHTIRSACKWFREGRQVTGKQIEIMLGILTHEFLFNRGALSVFRAAYTFVKDS